jgi:two-component system OmpR family sensor kinase
MSIFSKVIVLFIISLASMMFVSYKANKLTQITIETVLEDKYIHISEDLFKYLTDSDTLNLEKKFKELNFKIIEDKEYYLKSSHTIYDYTTELSSIKIFKYEDDKYLLYMKYLDDEILALQQLEKKNFEVKELLNYMILINILIIMTLFFIILKMTYPLREISASIKRFGEGQYCVRIKTSCKAEIGEVAKTFNLMAENIEDLITSRQRLLRDIGHELKTPIAKSIMAIEMIEDSKYKKILKKALFQLDEMTNELLSIEKINANQNKLNIQTFDIETLINESLSKLFIEDETSVNISIESNFSIDADLNYLSIALKNLIDNALKYSVQKPIFIIVEDKKISVKGKGEKLEKPLEFLCEAFTQGDNSRNQTGYGLGLSLVKRILNKHHFELSYTHEDGFNVFTIYPYETKKEI